MHRNAFMQGDVPPHITNLVKQLLNMHFRNYRIKNHHFPVLQDRLVLNLVNFKSGGYLKNIINNGLIANLANAHCATYSKCHH